jgi:hypothetical protein
MISAEDSDYENVVRTNLRQLGTHYMYTFDSDSIRFLLVLVENENGGLAATVQKVRRNQDIREGPSLVAQRRSAQRRQIFRLDNIDEVWIGTGEFDDTTHYRRMGNRVNNVVLVSGRNMYILADKVYRVPLRSDENIVKFKSREGNSGIVFGFLQTNYGIYTYTCDILFFPGRQQRDEEFYDCVQWNYLRPEIRQTMDPEDFQWFLVLE